MSADWRSKTMQICSIRYIEEAIAANPKPVADYRAGTNAAIGVLIGAVKRLSNGTANTQVAREMLIRRLAEPE